MPVRLGGGDLGYFLQAAAGGWFWGWGGVGDTKNFGEYSSNIVQPYLRVSVSFFLIFRVNLWPSNPILVITPWVVLNFQAVSLKTFYLCWYFLGTDWSTDMPIGRLWEDLKQRFRSETWLNLTKTNSFLFFGFLSGLTDTMLILSYDNFIFSEKNVLASVLLAIFPGSRHRMKRSDWASWISYFRVSSHWATNTFETVLRENWFRYTIQVNFHLSSLVDLHGRSDLFDRLQVDESKRRWIGI